MKLTDIGQKTKDSIYGDQSLSPNTINDFIWTTFSTFVIAPKSNCIPVQKFLDSCLVYDGEDFDEEVDFPSASYIKNNFEYNHKNKQDIALTYSWPASKKEVISILEVDTESNENVAKFLVDIEVKLEKEAKTWNYKLEVDFQDKGVDTIRNKVVKITPTYINGATERADVYVKDNMAPQFFDMELVENDTMTEIVMVSPSYIGDTFTIKVTLEDYITYSEIAGEIDMILLGRLSSEEDGNPVLDDAETNPILVDLEQVDNNGNLISPTFELFVMSDTLVDMFGQYMTMTSNFTGDEAQIASEQTAAYRTYNLDVKTFPATLFEYIPQEFKTLDGCNLGGSSKNKGNTRSVRGRLFQKLY